MADYNSDAPAIAHFSDPGYFESIVAYNQWLATNEANLPDYEPAAPTAGVPHFVRDGVRFFCILGGKFIRFYQRHKSTIDPYLSAALTAALNALLANASELEALDQPGPN